MDKKNIIIVVTHPIQYFVPLYQEISKERDLNLKVYYCSDETVNGGIDKHFGISIKWDIPLLEGYKFKFLKNNSWKSSFNNGFWGVINFSIIKELIRSPKSLVIVNGWSNFSYILTFIVGRLVGHKMAIRCEAPLFKEKKANNFKYYLRRFFLKDILFKYLIDIYFYVGSQNRKFYEYYKIEKEKLIYTPYSVNNEHFQKLNQVFDKEKLRNQFGYKMEDFIILFTGKFYEIKRPLDLLNAFLNLNLPNKKLVFVGDGKLRNQMDEFILNNSLENVNLTGFVNQTEIPKYYKMADILVLCSESETWGLSINEAMNFELPIVVYDSVGCAEDLVINNLNGIVVKKGNLTMLEDSILKFSENLEFKKIAGIRSLEIIQNFSYQNVIKGIKVAL